MAYRPRHAQLEFAALLAEATRAPSRIGHWQVETDIKALAEWQPGVGAATSAA
jgi:hypothetical protein